MSLTGILQLVLVAAIVVVGVLAERRVMGNETLLSVPRWIQTLLAGLALGGPWLLYFEGVIRTPVVDGLVATLAASCALWLLVMKTVGVGGARGTSC